MNTRKLSLTMALFFSTVTLVTICLILNSPLIASAHSNSNLSDKLNDSEAFSIKLTGATSYELTEIFYQLLNQTPGVTEAKQYRSRIEPDAPHKSLAEWRVQTDARSFDLEKNLLHQVQEYIAASDNTDSLPVPFAIGDHDLEMLARIKPYSAAAHEITFVLHFAGHGDNSELKSGTAIHNIGEKPGGLSKFMRSISCSRIKKHQI
jgi:hypothetical protein